MLDDFYKHKRMADGHLNVCKPCRNSYVTGWVAANAERKKSIARKSAAASRTPEKSAAAWRKWYEVARTTQGPKFAERTRRRDFYKSQATPSWANVDRIREMYDLAAGKTQTTGVKWQVDHMVPLQSLLVCGLHVEHNLNVIPATENARKKNHYWPDMAEEIA